MVELVRRERALPLGTWWFDVGWHLDVGARLGLAHGRRGVERALVALNPAVALLECVAVFAFDLVELVRRERALPLGPWWFDVGWHRDVGARRFLAL